VGGLVQDVNADCLCGLGSQQTRKPKPERRNSGAGSQEVDWPLKKKSLDSIDRSHSTEKTSGGMNYPRVNSYCCDNSDVLSDKKSGTQKFGQRKPFGPSSVKQGSKPDGFKNAHQPKKFKPNSSGHCVVCRDKVGTQGPHDTSACGRIARTRKLPEWASAPADQVQAEAIRWMKLSSMSITNSPDINLRSDSSLVKQLKRKLSRCKPEKRRSKLVRPAANSLKATEASHILSIQSLHFDVKDKDKQLVSKGERVHSRNVVLDSVRRDVMGGRGQRPVQAGMSRAKTEMENMRVPGGPDIKFCLLHMTNSHCTQGCRTLSPLYKRLPFLSDGEIVRNHLYLRGSKDWEARVALALANGWIANNSKPAQLSLGGDSKEVDEKPCCAGCSSRVYQKDLSCNTKDCKNYKESTHLVKAPEKLVIPDGCSLNGHSWAEVPMCTADGTFIHF
jgi:hypothetical protein